jgi:hypothetical protein
LLRAVLVRDLHFFFSLRVRRLASPAAVLPFSPCFLLLSIILQITARTTCN